MLAFTLLATAIFLGFYLHAKGILSDICWTVIGFVWGVIAKAFNFIRNIF